MKLITFASESHFPLLENFFLKSFLEHPQGIDQLIVYHMPQPVPVPSFGSPEYWQHSRRQAVLTAEAMREAAEGDTIVFSDCDVQWFQSLEVILQYDPDQEFVAQMDPPDILCGGFMRFKVNARTRAFCQIVVDHMQRPEDGHATFWMNQLARGGLVHYTLFPTELVWCTHYVWANGNSFPEVPKGIAVQHASWIIDLSSKLALLDYVRRVMKSPKP